LECLNDDICPQDLLLIFATNECYNGTKCREEYPLLFNNKCYNKNNCPENTVYKIDAPKTCSCVNYNYIEENSDIICMDKNDYCPEGYPNLIYIKNKCVKNDDEELKDLYNFNGIYYIIVLCIQCIMKKKINAYVIHYMAIGIKMKMKEIVYIVV